MIKQTYLFVVAHADDEALGAGAMIYELAKKGHRVEVCILCTEDTTRSADHGRRMILDIKRSHEILGIDEPYMGNFKDNQFNAVPQLDLVKFIEKVITEVNPDYVFTHHTSDINPDHHYTSIACKQAVRLPQRLIQDMKRIKALYYMEIPSSTDWALSENPFRPDTFIEVSDYAVGIKIESIEVYENVIRPMPHPRSREAIQALSVIRGTQAGFERAEAFQTAFRFMPL